MADVAEWLLLAFAVAAGVAVFVYGGSVLAAAATFGCIAATAWMVVAFFRD